MKRLENILADPESLVIFGVIVCATIIAAFLVKRFFKTQLIKKDQGPSVNLTSFVFLKHFITTTIYLVGFGWALLTLPITKTFAHSLLAGAGASTLIIGFASQQVLSNMVSGIFIIINSSC